MPHVDAVQSAEVHATSQLIPDAIRRELVPGETVLWSGHGPDSPLSATHIIAGVAGFVMIAAGTVILVKDHQSPAGGFWLDYLFGGFLVVVGLFIGIGAPYGDWRRDRLSTYAVTDRRAIIVNDIEGVASYFLNERLEVCEGVGHTIHFGRQWGQYRDDRMHMFTRIPDAPTVAKLIDEIRTRRSAIATAYRPFAGLPTSHVPSGASPVPAHPAPLAYAQPVLQQLHRGEVPLYVARPRQGMIFRADDWWKTAFLVVWLAIALWTFWRFRSNPSQMFLGPMFLMVGLYGLIGRFAVDSAARGRRWYALTPQRCLIVDGDDASKTKSAPWAMIQGTFRRPNPDGTTSLLFELNALGRNAYPRHHRQRGFTDQPAAIYFDRIENPREVEAMVMQQVMKEPL